MDYISWGRLHELIEHIKSYYNIHFQQFRVKDYTNVGTGTPILC